MKHKTPFALMTFGLVLFGACGFAQEAAVPAKATDPQKQDPGAAFDDLKGLGSIAALFEAESKAQLSYYQPQDVKTVEVSRKLGTAYLDSVETQGPLRLVLGSALFDYYRAKAGTKSAAQVSQIADEVGVKMGALNIAQQQRIIQQNDRIIVLLEKIAQK